VAGIRIDTKKYDDCTLGRLYCGEFQCMTLELPWLGNEPNISCIPEGDYECVKYTSPRSGSEVILVLTVEGREAIEIHSGNYTRQILGCILVGDSVKWLDSDSIPDVTNSKATLQKLLSLLPHKFTLSIARS